ncbi:MAG: abscisic acid-deficient protein Aba4 family protein [Candidatus Thermoplasmatota archaeon]|nr:abscisic acid-deficient protein Aba4 family protein [Candidatus Thermoplasmatota archaeon]
MDLYTISFFFSTMWVGPFWFGMLVYPEHKLTQKVMQGPWFFLGPILMWWIVTLADPQGLIDLAKDSSDPTTILESLATILGTPAGAAAAWAHMVAGDIFVTRWMWVRCMEEKVSRKIMAPIIFFGVMLMPIGVALYTVLVRPEKPTN